AVLDLRLDVVTVHHGDEVDRDRLGTGHLALAVVGARPEVLLHHLDHALGAGPAFGLALGEQVEVGDLGGGEQVGGAVRAGGHTGAAADAGGGVEGGVG